MQKKIKMVLFLVNHAGFGLDQAQDFVVCDFDRAKILIEKIKKDPTFKPRGKSKSQR